jgi:3-hexulose-6-phosphate synthase
MSTKRRAWKGDWPKVQVALDLIRLEDALRIARAANRAGVEWIEAGTPLIKSEGMRSIKELKKALPDAVIVADMKTLDAGAIEMGIAYEAGADIVSISGLAHDSTIKDSAKARDRYGRRLMVDLLMTSSPVIRARELERLGADIICLHTGVDEQKASGSSLRLSPALRNLTRTLKIPLAAAGGINPRLAPKVAAAGVKVLIVGGWITGSKDPFKAAVELVSSLRGIGVEKA